MNIYVGNLSYEVTEEDLQKAFEGFGQIESLKIIKDNYSRRSKGFGFAEMSDSASVHSAIDALDGKELKGRTLKVSKVLEPVRETVETEEIEGEEDDMKG
jgi:RNA recognition motif-containing protein